MASYLEPCPDSKKPEKPHKDRDKGKSSGPDGREAIPAATNTKAVYRADEMSRGLYYRYFDQLFHAWTDVCEWHRRHPE